MRIITGSARGRRLEALEGMEVRPTPEKIKEALFNIIQFRIEGRVFLDMFAGSGQIGLEALSRGAEKAFFLDASKKSIAVIERNVSHCGFEDSAKVINADSVVYVRNIHETFDVAFLDPPYRTGLLLQGMEAAAGKLSAGGILIAEHPIDEELPERVGSLKKLKDYKYGKIILTSYEHADD